MMEERETTVDDVTMTEEKTPADLIREYVARQRRPAAESRYGAGQYQLRGGRDGTEEDHD
jgi:hypothetical protein